MPVDSSIFQNVRPVPINIPSPIDAATGAMTLGRLGMQNQQMQLQFQQQQALRQAYAQNTGPDGSINKQGVLTSLGNLGMGQMVPELGKSFAEQDKAQAEAQSARADAENKAVGIALPHFEYLDSVPDDQKPTAYHNTMKELADKGMPMHNVPPEFSQDWLDSTMAQIKNTPAYQAQQQAAATLGETKAKTAEALANARLAPAKLAGEQFGRSSPNVAVSGQYTDDPAVKSAKSSQVYMNQMMDAFRHPSPYSDDALAMNAMKIKFPGAPDVGSFEEFKNSPAATDAMKNYVSQKLQGLKAPGARENLMRDAVSTYLPNVETLRGAQQKYYQKAMGQGIPNAADIVAEPGIDKTETAVRALNKELGPYVPPTERGGFMGAISGAASNLMGNAPAAKGASDQITSSAANAKLAPPKPGEARRGFVFNGGDPSDKRNWKKVQ